MSEPVDLVEQELALIKEIEKLADEQYVLKMVRRFNNSSVRAWRLNIMRRVQSVQEQVTGVFSEDEYKYINSQINSLNGELDTFGTINFDNAMALSGQSREIKEKFAELEKELSEKIENIEPLTTSKTKFLTRVSDTRKLLAEEKRRRSEVQKTNEDIEEDNKEIEAQMALYRGEAREWVNSLNKRLEGIYDGNVAFFDEETQEIKCYSPEDIAEDLSSFIPEQVEPQRFISGLPSDLYDELYTEWIDDPTFLLSKTKLYSKILDFANREFEKEKLPEKPVEDFEKLEKVPEIQKRKVKTSDITIPLLSESTILQGNEIPDEIIEELQSYRQGKYELTIRKADRINELAEKYNLLSIEIVEKDGKQSVRAINSKIRELMSVQNAFGSERNSRAGQAQIKAFVEATQEFLGHTRNQERIFGEYYNGFKNAAKDLEDWINRSWWQFGGQPENHHSAGSSDGSAVTKSSSSKSNYNGPTL